MKNRAYFNQKQKEYVARLSEGGTLCACGTPAVKKFNGYPACQSCIDIEVKIGLASEKKKPTCTSLSTKSKKASQQP